jgi:Skp family chaperone for outer membrane proteins
MTPGRFIAAILESVNPNAGGAIRDVPHRLAGHLHGIVAFLALGASNALAWAQSFNAGALAAGLTTLGLALVGLAAYALKQIGPAWTEYTLAKTRAAAELQVQLDKLNEGTLSRQLAALKGDTEKLRQSLHESRNEASTERLRHHEETGRLTEQLRTTTEELRATRDELHATRDELRAAHDENRRLLVEVHRIGHRVEGNAADIAELKGQPE